MTASAAPDSLGDWPVLVWVGIALIAAAWLTLLALCAMAARTPVAASAPDTSATPTRANCQHVYAKLAGRVFACTTCDATTVIGNDEPYDQEASRVVAEAEAILREVSS
jgi:hypothetical protein